MNNTRNKWELGQEGIERLWKRRKTLTVERVWNIKCNQQKLKRFFSYCLIYQPSNPKMPQIGQNDKDRERERIKKRRIGCTLSFPSFFRHSSLATCPKTVVEITRNWSKATFIIRKIGCFWGGSQPILPWFDWPNLRAGWPKLSLVLIFSNFHLGLPLTLKSRFIIS